MKTLLRIASLALLALLCLTWAAVPTWAQNWSYDNGPVNGTTTGWMINSGHIVSDSFYKEQKPDGTLGGSTKLFVWESPGDTLTSLDWSITSQENGGTVYGSGTASGANLTDTFISTNQFGYDIDLITASGLNFTDKNHKDWLNLQNAISAQGNPVYWDENSGVGCQSDGCPSQAYDSALGTIPSEAFTIYGSDSSTPEPSSLLLFGSGVLGIGGLLRKRLFG